jgi:hypothetical protein
MSVDRLKEKHSEERDDDVVQNGSHGLRMVCSPDPSLLIPPGFPRLSVLRLPVEMIVEMNWGAGYLAKSSQFLAAHHPVDECQSQLEE